MFCHIQVHQSGNDTPPPCVYLGLHNMLLSCHCSCTVQKFQSNSCSTENKNSLYLLLFEILELSKSGVSEGVRGLSVHRLGNLTSGIPYSDCFIAWCCYQQIRITWMPAQLINTLSMTFVVCFFSLWLNQITTLFII